MFTWSTHKKVKTSLYNYFWSKNKSNFPIKTLKNNNYKHS